MTVKILPVTPFKAPGPIIDVHCHIFKLLWVLRAELEKRAAETGMTWQAYAQSCIRSQQL